MFPALKFWLIFLFASYPLITSGATRGVRSLITSILLEYSSITPPNDAEALKVGLSLSLQHVGTMDEKEGMLKIGIWLRQNWTDNFLGWDRTQYNVTSIFLPRKIVWIPDTTVRKGDVLTKSESRDIMANEYGEVTSSSALDVVLPCVPREDSHSADASNGGDGDGDGGGGDGGSGGVGNRGQHAMVCSLAIGSWIEPLNNVEYEVVVVDMDDFHESSAADWKLSGIKPYSTVEQGLTQQRTSSVVVFDFTLMKNDTLDHTLLQFITPSILTSLAAMGVFSLPPLAGERVLMAAIAFLGQLVLAGFSVVAQIQSADYDKLRNFMTFSTVYDFLVVMSVLVRFLVSPFLKRAATLKPETGELENDEEKLISIKRAQINGAVPDVILFVLFLTLYCIGMATVFS